MNKTELAGQIAERAGVSAAEAGRVLDASKAPRFSAGARLKEAVKA